MTTPEPTPINPEYLAQLVRDAKGSGLRFALTIAAALAVIIGAALALGGCSVSLYSREWGPPSQAECDAYPETAEPAACARYAYRGDQ